MLRKTINDIEIELYDSIDELPITRYQWFNRQMMIDSGVGGDLDAFNRRCVSIARLIDTDASKAKVEIQNLMGSVHFMMNNVNPEMNAFVGLVKSVDGKDLPNEITDDIVKSTLSKIGGVKLSWIRRMIKKIKRGIRREMNTFLKKGNDGQTRQYYQNLQTALERELERIQKDELDSDMGEIDQFLAESVVIKRYLGDVQIKDITGFERVCSIISKYFNDKAKNLSTLEFYDRIELMKEANK
jgi:hypothetical protein